MTTTIGAFRRSVVADRIPAVKKLAAFHLWNGVTEMSPVLTGRYRAAWNMAVDSADLSVPPEPPKGTVLPPPTPPAIGYIPPGAPVVVSNNLPYAGAIEKGHSGRAPRGVAAVTIRNVLAAFPGLVSEVKAAGEQGGL